VLKKRKNGMATGSRVKVLGTASQYLATSMYYDERGRVVQTLSDNQSTGVDITTNQYDFSGKVLSSYLRHQKNGGTAVTTTVLTKMEYDHAGRVKNIKKILNGGTEKTIATHTYDELGRQNTKQLGGPETTLHSPPSLPTHTFSGDVSDSIVRVGCGTRRDKEQSSPI
jgi:hypothetical protein